jgi:hypothetical protein
MGYEYVSFSNAVIGSIGHDFSFLESEQFPADVKIRRVDYNSTSYCALRIVIESASYTKTMEEALAGSGLTIICYTRQITTEDGKVVQFMDYNSIPDDFWPTGTVEFGQYTIRKALYAKLVTRRKRIANDNTNAGPNQS